MKSGSRHPLTWTDRQDMHAKAIQEGNSCMVFGQQKEFFIANVSGGCARQ